MTKATDGTRQKPFWEAKSLAEMTAAEWESLCDGCGQCCLHRFEDEDTGEFFVTHAACRLLDLTSCRCKHYETRHRYVPHCVVIRPGKLSSYRWLPDTCAYKRLAHGKALPEWHPLLTGDPESVHRAGVSVRGFAVSEDDVDLDAIEAML